MSKVIVGISGGVDSAVAAALLLEQGYEVIGITFRFTEEFDSKDAVNVCKKLNIEHHIIDYRNIFKEKIINKFINDYKKGITPNPCVLCNREIKFNFLYEKMLELNCDYIATGHYAKVIDGRLYKSIDLNKDQTYFLSQLTNKELSKLLLPLEGITKDKVRDIAHKYNLTIADKKDSTDICFINSNFNDFISEKINSNPGNIINISNNTIIGKHKGLNNYTIGQRKGLDIGGTENRLYVVGKDIKDNILYVAYDDENNYLISTSCILTKINLINKNKYTNVKVKFRYRQKEINAKLEYVSDKEIIVNYPEGVKSVTPGQICTFYNENECLGSGIIKIVMKNNKRLWYL